MKMLTNICRICLGHDLLTSIFLKRGLTMISTSIMSITKVYISPNDGLPNTICTKCIKALDNCIEFIQLCERTDAELRSFLEKNNVEQEINNKIYLQVSNSPKIYDSPSPRSDNEECLLIDENYSETNQNNDENPTQFDEKKNKSRSKKAQKQQCSTCGKVMSSRFRLKTHLRTHTGERPYTCPHCNKNFSLAQNLKVHIRVHTGEKPHQCSVCGQSFAQSAGLAAHKRKHTGQKPYLCVLCPRSFRTVGHLQYHVRRHTGEKNFECDTCGHAFITRSDLKQHLLTHSGDRPHVCCHCGLRLSRASHLKRHIQHIHKNQKEFFCEKCSSRFKDKEDFERHKKWHEDEGDDVNCVENTVPLNLDK